jgi:hypothetical protein
MRTRLAFVAVAFAAATALGITTNPAAADTQSAHHFAVGIVRLDGAQEFPGPGDADGRGTFAYAAFRDKLCYLLTARNVETPVAAHIHAGARGVAGGIVVALETPADGLSFACITAVSNDTPNTTMLLLQSELDAIIANPAGFYANVHTGTFPAGAIRGQLR